MKSEGKKNAEKVKANKKIKNSPLFYNAPQCHDFRAAWSGSLAWRQEYENKNKMRQMRDLGINI